MQIPKSVYIFVFVCRCSPCQSQKMFVVFYFYICVKVLALPIPIVVDNFAAYYDEQKLQAALVDSRLSFFEKIFFVLTIIRLFEKITFHNFKAFWSQVDKKAESIVDAERRKEALGVEKAGLVCLLFFRQHFALQLFKK